MKRIDLLGKSFNKLTVISESCYRNKKLFWLCKCECGNTTEVPSQSLRNGSIKSCGCLHVKMLVDRLTTHGLTAGNKTKPAEYGIWAGIIQRCTNGKNDAYEKYGGRGITICDRWRYSFINFLQDIGNRPSQLYSIDRINVNGNYEPGNCRWATDKEQGANKRSNVFIEFNGETAILSDWAIRLNARQATIRYMLKKFSFSDIHSFFTTTHSFHTIKMWKRNIKLTA